MPGRKGLVDDERVPGGGVCDGKKGKLDRFTISPDKRKKGKKSLRRSKALTEPNPQNTGRHALSLSQETAVRGPKDSREGQGGARKVRFNLGGERFSEFRNSPEAEIATPAELDIRLPRKTPILWCKKRLQRRGKGWGGNKIL